VAPSHRRALSELDVTVVYAAESTPVGSEVSVSAGNLAAILERV
jgi:hypothetical protein